jgi:hypothetical protein
MQAANPQKVKPSHPLKKSPHASWQAEQQKHRQSQRRVMRRLAGKR